MEVWDLYDKNRNKTGETAVRGGPRIPPGRYHIVVHAAVFNDREEMLIQQRQPWKDVFPGLWDITMGGSAVAGEDAPRACFRELEEEVGLSLPAVRDGRAVFTVNFGDGFDDYFVARWNGDPSSLVLQESEVKAVRWAGREEIAEMTRAGTFIPYHPGLMDLVFLHNTHNSIYDWK